MGGRLARTAGGLKGEREKTMSAMSELARGPRREAERQLGVQAAGMTRAAQDDVR